MLQGIVKGSKRHDRGGFESANKAYFLRENDPVYNGFVMRITPDSVVFREQVSDKFGKTSTREIVKKVDAPFGLGEQFEPGKQVDCKPTPSRHD